MKKISIFVITILIFTNIINSNAYLNESVFDLSTISEYEGTTVTSTYYNSNTINTTDLNIVLNKDGKIVLYSEGELRTNTTSLINLENIIIEYNENYYIITSNSDVYLLDIDTLNVTFINTLNKDWAYLLYYDKLNGLLAVAEDSFIKIYDLDYVNNEFNITIKNSYSRNATEEPIYMETENEIWFLEYELVKYNIQNDTFSVEQLEFDSGNQEYLMGDFGNYEIRIYEKSLQNYITIDMANVPESTGNITDEMIIGDYAYFNVTNDGKAIVRLSELLNSENPSQYVYDNLNNTSDLIRVLNNQKDGFFIYAYDDLDNVKLYFINTVNELDMTQLNIELHNDDILINGTSTEKLEININGNQIGTVLESNVLTSPPYQYVNRYVGISNFMDYYNSAWQVLSMPYNYLTIRGQDSNNIYAQYRILVQNPLFSEPKIWSIVELDSTEIQANIITSTSTIDSNEQITTNSAQRLKVYVNGQLVDTLTEDSTTLGGQYVYDNLQLTYYDYADYFNQYGRQLIEIKDGTEVIYSESFISEEQAGYDPTPTNPIIDEEEGIFDFINNFAQRVDNVMNTFVNAATSVKNLVSGWTGVMADVFSFMPTELMQLLTFGLIAMLIVKIFT